MSWKMLAIMGSGAWLPARGKLASTHNRHPQRWVAHFRVLAKFCSSAYPQSVNSYTFKSIS
jgi:hypothetical protein